MSDIVGTVVGLWRYPVKSMLGEQVDALAFTARGPEDDRRWAMQGPDGRLGSGKSGRRFVHMDGLLRLRASVERGVPVVTLPSGAVVRGGGVDFDAAVGAAVGMPVTLVEEAEVPHVDDAPVHLVTTSSLEAWAAAAGADAVDALRARPNLVIATDDRGRPEDAWEGHTLAVGGVRLRVTKRTERCVMVTAEQAGLAHDTRLLRALIPADRCVGVYADVAAEGRITTGDEVHLLD